jgi:hypothetical protein
MKRSEHLVWSSDSVRTLLKFCREALAFNQFSVVIAMFSRKELEELGQAITEALANPMLTDKDNADPASVILEGNL